MNSEVRVVKYFSDTVADYAYRLEKKCSLCRKRGGNCAG